MFYGILLFFITIYNTIIIDFGIKHSTGIVIQLFFVQVDNFRDQWNIFLILTEAEVKEPDLKTMHTV